MGLVQNLKKRLGRLAERILVELSYHYIIQKAKQTSRKPSNYLQTTSSQNRLTMGHQDTIIATSSQDISEKTIMASKTTEDIVAHVSKWATDKVESAELVGDKIALYAEFEDWIELEDDDNIEVISLEQQD